MAFHVACSITCRRICDCELGFPEALRSGSARGEFVDEIAALEEFLADPWTIRVAGGPATVEVPVPRLEAPAMVSASAAGDGEDAAARDAAAMKRRAVEEYARRLEAEAAADGDDLLAEDTPLATEDQAASTAKVICRICFSGEKEGSNKALKMLPCKMCNKKYHMRCLKNWAKNRDLFHWNSWACPSCRICEVCRRAGDPNKLMYCRRCDGAYHCYCQQPPHKNVGHGPYVCPKHTRCHSCGSTVPGSGPSTRWFLGYTCCDACGRLFVKGNYCPICLKQQL